jgi:hypothetical protein
MKLITSLLKYILILTLITFSMNKTFKNSHKHKHHSHSKEILNFYATNAQNYVNFARLAYCSRNVIQDMTCSFCPTVTQEYAPFFIHSVSKENNRSFQFVIVYSDAKREIVVSFSGPTTEHGNYFTSIYSSGFVEISELGGIKIENEYWDIYSNNMRQVLAEKIAEISNSNRADYTFIFVGHSFGGSLATLASYDLVVNNVVIKTHNSPLVYTYGPLRIGDSDFVNKVNSVVKVVKILRKDDYVTRMPNCVFLHGQYRCYNNISTVAQRMPVLRNYVSGYRRQIFMNFLEKDPIVRGTTYIGGQLYRTHQSMFYSQPFGTELIYNGNNFSNALPCKYVNNIPICERHMRLPATFSPDVHRFYYNTNLEMC